MLGCRGSVRFLRRVELESCKSRRQGSGRRRGLSIEYCLKMLSFFVEKNKNSKSKWLRDFVFVEVDIPVKHT